jgi:hypothetical protein
MTRLRKMMLEELQRRNYSELDKPGNRRSAVLAPDFTGLATRALRPIYCKRRYWFRANVPLEGDCYAHVLAETRSVAGMRCAHYKYFLIVSHVNRDTSAKGNS